MVDRVINLDQDINVSQFGWSTVKSTDINILQEYINYVKELVDDTKDLEAAVEYIKTIYPTIQDTFEQVNIVYASATDLRNYVTELHGEVMTGMNYVLSAVQLTQGLEQNTKGYLDATQEIKTAVELMQSDIIGYLSDFNHDFADFRLKYQEMLDLYEVLLRQQVYRGIWNPNDGDWPDPQGTNSVWDVRLNDGQLSFAFGGFTWSPGDRVLYLVDDNKWEQIASINAVTAVNGRTGAVILSPSDVNITLENGTGAVARVTGPTISILDTRITSLENYDKDQDLLPEIPYPDVWIPFNDSLLMQAGYGDELKIGPYTVAKQATFTRSSTATYIDKSGVLRTAAINEPRFEKEGLLVEGSSTNLAINSNTWLTRDGAAVTSDSDGWYPVGAATDATVVGVQLRVGTTVDWSTTLGGQPISLSAFVKGTGNVELETAVYAAFTLGGKVTVNLDNGTITSTTSGLTSSIRRISTNEYRITLTATVSTNVSTAIGRGLYVNGLAGSVAYARFGQIEALPFASSYIPTDGAAVTRAADTCYLDSVSKNLPISKYPEITVAVQLDRLYNSTNGVWDIAVSASGYLNSNSAFNNEVFRIGVEGTAGSGARRSWKLGGQTATPYYVSATDQPWTTQTTHAMSVKEGRSAYSCGSYFGTFTQEGFDYGMNPVSRLCIGHRTSGTTAANATNQSSTWWGHIRNLRIWHQALSDRQLKTLR